MEFEVYNCFGCLFVGIFGHVWTGIVCCLCLNWVIMGFGRLFVFNVVCLMGLFVFIDAKSWCLWIGQVVGSGCLLVVFGVFGCLDGCF